MISCQKRYRYIDIEISKQGRISYIDKALQVFHKYMDTKIEVIYQNIFIWQIYLF